MTLSIILSTFNRSHLLVPSLWAYTRVLTESDELIIIDDGSEDSTQERVFWFQHHFSHLDIKYIHVHSPEWRDCGATYNIGIRMARNEFVILTHPEVVPGRETLEEFRLSAYDGVFVTAKAYYLSPEQQARCVLKERFDTDYVRRLPGFYDEPSAEFSGNLAYTPRAIESNPRWESLIFGGLSRAHFHRIGGMFETSTWGTVDVAFLERRRALDIPNITLMHMDSYCVHQNHDIPFGEFVPTDRDMDECMSNIPVINAETAIANNL